MILTLMLQIFSHTRSYNHHYRDSSNVCWFPKTCCLKTEMFNDSCKKIWPIPTKSLNNLLSNVCNTHLFQSFDQTMKYVILTLRSIPCPQEFLNSYKKFVCEVNLGSDIPHMTWWRVAVRSSNKERIIRRSCEKFILSEIRLRLETVS